MPRNDPGRGPCDAAHLVHIGIQVPGKHPHPRLSSHLFSNLPLIPQLSKVAAICISMCQLLRVGPCLQWGIRPWNTILLMRLPVGAHACTLSPCTLTRSQPETHSNYATRWSLLNNRCPVGSLAIGRVRWLLVIEISLPKKTRRPVTAAKRFISPTNC